MKTTNDQQPLEQATDLCEASSPASLPANSGLPIAPVAAIALPSPSTSTPSQPSHLQAKSEHHRMQSLLRKQRADSFLNTLTPTQRAAVLQSIADEPDIGLVRQYVTAPAPEGLGLEVSLSTLRRIRAHVTAAYSTHRNVEIFDTLIDMETQGDFSQANRIESAINHFLHEKAFELARTEPAAIELNDLLLNIQKLSALDLKRQQIALQREKLLHRAQLSANPPPPRKHQVQLTILPANRQEEPSHAQKSIENT